MQDFAARSREKSALLEVRKGGMCASGCEYLFIGLKPILKARGAPAPLFIGSRGLTSSLGRGADCRRRPYVCAAWTNTQSPTCARGTRGDYNAPKTFLISELAWPIGSFLMARSSAAISPNRPSSALAVT